MGSGCRKQSRDFCHQYGVVEELYEVEYPSDYNATSKAVKRKVREKFLPGISPIVYSRFLLENAVFLSLADMGQAALCAWLGEALQVAGSALYT